MPLLEVEKVSKGFGGVRAVHDVSFTLEPGELVGIMGPNGSGKTTLFNLIAGALVPDGGRVRLHGRDIAGLAPHRICARGIARTFQLVRPFAGLTARDNVLVGRFYGRHRGSRAAALAEAERLLTLVGLDGRADTPAARLTLIDRKRLELARALATRPKLLLLDEIAGGLTEHEAGELVGELARIKAQGVTMVWIEHVVHALLAIADRLFVVNFGQKLAEGEPRAVMAHPEVLRVYMGIDA